MITVPKIAACAMAGAIIFSGYSTTAKAEEAPIAGIDITLSNSSITSLTEDLGVSLLTLPRSEKEKGKLVFAKVEDYANIRNQPSEDGEILGKLYKDSVATIIAKEGDWYNIKSGSVTGYIKSEFLLTGEEAKTFSKKVGRKIAVINTKTLRVRQKASKKSSILTLVPHGEEYKVIKEKEDWVKIKVNSHITGYVSNKYIKLKRVYKEAISLEEERAEQEQAIQLMNIQSETSAKKSNASVQDTTDHSSSLSTSVAKKISYGSDSIRSKIVDYALRFEGNPYVWGGTSLTRGADCSGFTQSVFEDYGISIPRTSREQAAAGRRVSLNEIKPGDLIFYTRYGTINHVALYIGNGKVIAAKSPSEGIRIANYDYRTPYKAVSYIN